MGSIAGKRCGLSQGLSKGFLERHWKSLVLSAKEIHAGQVVPWLISYRLEERLCGLWSQQCNSFLLLFRWEVIIEDCLSFGGVDIPITLSLVSIETISARRGGTTDRILHPWEPLTTQSIEQALALWYCKCTHVY